MARFLLIPQKLNILKVETIQASTNRWMDKKCGIYALKMEGNSATRYNMGEPRGHSAQDPVNGASPKETNTVWFHLHSIKNFKINGIYKYKLQLENEML